MRRRRTLPVVAIVTRTVRCAIVRHQAMNHQVVTVADCQLGLIFRSTDGATIQKNRGVWKTFLRWTHHP